METKDSSSLFENEITDNGFSYEKKQREIMCQEIKGLFVKYSMDGNSQQAKEQRQNIMEEFFGIRSWIAIENMKSNILKEFF